MSTAALEPHIRARIDTLEETICQLREMLHLDSPPMFGLTPTEWRCVLPILRDGKATHAHILHEAYFDCGDRAPSDNTIKVLIHKARHKLVHHGITIETVWGWGYSVDRTQIPQEVRDAITRNFGRRS